MRPPLVRMLACVACGGDLQLSAEETAADGHVLRGMLTCAACAAVFQVTRGVPRLTRGDVAGDVGQTVEAFGYQWEQATALFEQRFSSPETFLDFVRPVEASWVFGKTVLDGGCGSGRFTLVCAGLGARAVLGVDLSSAVDVAFDRTRHLENVLIAQGDMLHLPLRRAFDYAFSIGVLHHTADPRTAFLQLASKVVPGGGVSAWVYGAENNAWILRLLNPARRVTSRMPRPLLMVLAHVAAVPITLAVKGVYGPISRRPRLAWLRSRLFYFDYFVFLSQFGYREHAIIVFDHAVPAIAEYISRDEFGEWFEAAGLQRPVITDRAGNSWRGFGFVPA